jgi:hypothetical protein
VAKADLGLVPVAADGSASFRAPAGKVLYFQVLDQSFNELQRMRSVVQLQPGETRGCIGCHDHRAVAPSGKMLAAVRREPEPPQPPPWGTDAFSYARIVQPVWDAQCLRCHGPTDPRGFNLAGTLDTERVPASYRTLIERGWVHHFSYQWQEEHHKAEPLTFGTLKSRLWPLLDAGHYEVKLTEEEQRRIKCWTDLNCPLWPDYRFRLDRPAVAATQSPTP